MPGEFSRVESKTIQIRQVMIAFALGAVCFLATQVFTRVPLLGWLQKQPIFVTWTMSFPLLSGVMTALSAGVFEESGRFAFKSFLLKPEKSPFWEPVVFGLGHGLCEAVWVLIPVFGRLILISPGKFILPIVERLLAIIMHIGLSVIVWNGFQLNKRWQYLLAAILIHGLVNALIPLAGILGWGILQLEGLFAGITGLFLIYVIYSRKYYIEKESYETSTPID